VNEERAASSPSPPSLADEQRQLTRDRIRRAAMTVVARRGFDATVEEIARESGVSSRTIFRHYTTQGSLILATVKDMFEACGRRPIAGLPVLEEDLDGWLEVLSATIHTRNAEILGRAFWDLHAAHSGGSYPLAEVAALRRLARRRGVNHLAVIVWSAAGGTGEPPDDVVCAFALHFSAFATQSLMVDFDKTPGEIGRLSADSLKLTLRRAVDQQRGSDPTFISGRRSPSTMIFAADDTAGPDAIPPGGPWS
jgi:AcrR family transcriptional regulator